MMIAEELQCDWNKVRGEYASANRDRGSGLRSGRSSSRRKALPIRSAAVAGGSTAGDQKISWTGVYRRMTTNRTGRSR